MQKHANASSDLLISVYCQLAHDPARDINGRTTDIRKLVELNAIPKAIEAATIIANDVTIEIMDRLSTTKILLKTGSKDTTISAYTQIMETINSTDTMEENDKFDSLVDVGIGLHKAGATELGLGILMGQFQWLQSNAIASHM